MKTQSLTVKPYPFQEQGIDFIYRHYWTLCGDEQGLGKTLQALGLIARVGGSHNIVVCPAGLQATWKEEIRSKLPDYEDKITIISYDKFRKVEPIKLDCLIFDEAHYLKNHKALRTRTVFEWAITHPPRYLLMLTGTPIKNHVTEFFSPIYILSCCPFESNGEKWKYGYWAFCEKFSNRTVFQMRGREVSKYEGLKNVSKLKDLLHNKYIRRLAKNCLDLPEMVRKNIWINNAKVDISLGVAYDNYKDSGAFPTLKADVALSKAEFTANYALDILREGPVLIYSDHREPVHAIEKILLEAGHMVGSIMGGISLKVRQAQIDGFRDGKIDVLVMTIGSASTGLTLTRANHIIFNDIPWVPADLQQAEKRIHRIGQTKTCFIHYCLTGKVDQHILETILNKSRLLKKAL